MQPGEELDDVHEEKIEERDEAAEQQHRDDDYDSRIAQLLVAAEPSFFRVPRPRGFLELDFYLVEKVLRFRDHGSGMVEAWKS